MGTFALHGLILCVSEGFLYELLYIHIVGMEILGLHGLILCVSEGFFSELLCIYIVGMGIFAPHALKLSVFHGKSVNTKITMKYLASMN